jgi:hypothetical protein
MCVISEFPVIIIWFCNSNIINSKLEFLMKRVVRWSVKQAPKRCRHEASTGHESTVLKKYHTLFVAFLALALTENNRPRRKETYAVLMAIYVIKRERLRFVYLPPLVPNRRKLFVIESFNESDSFRYLRFKKHLLRLGVFKLDVFKLDEFIVLDDGNLYHREMMFLLLLYRYAQGGTFYNLEQRGWGDEGTACRAFNTSSRLLYMTWRRLIHNDLPRVVRRFPEFNAAFKRRLRSVMGPNAPLPRDAENLVLIIDGTRRSVGEPVDRDVEDSVYSGYLGTHCMGYLAMVDPTLMCPWIKGPFVGRDPDQVFVPLATLSAICSMHSNMCNITAGRTEIAFLMIADF